MLEIYTGSIFNVIPEVLPFVPYFLFKGTVFFYNYTVFANNIIPVTSFIASWFICDEFFFTSVFPKVFDMSVFPETAYTGIEKAYSKMFRHLGDHNKVCFHIAQNMELFYNRAGFDTSYVKDALSYGGRHLNRYPDVCVVMRLIGENMLGDSSDLYTYKSIIVDHTGKRVRGGFGPNNPFQYPHHGRVFRLPNSKITFNYLPYEMHFKHLCFLGASFILLGAGVCFYSPDLIITAFNIVNNTLYYIFSKFI